MVKYMKSKSINKQLDDLYDAIDVLMKHGHWQFLDDVLLDVAGKSWRMDLDIILGWVTATFPAKSKLKNRENLILQGKRFHPDPELWKGLE